MVKYGLLVGLAIAALFSMVAFVWHTELAFDVDPRVWLTNGFWTNDPMQVYHVWLYLMFATNILLIWVVLTHFKKAEEG